MAIVGVGIDVVDVDRADAMLTPRRRPVLDRLLTPAELGYVMKMPRPARHLAVRLAAKEAVYKAMQALPGSRPIGWRDIEVVRGEHGRPSVVLHGLALAVAERNGNPAIHLSLTHSARSAVAAAVLER